MLRRPTRRGSVGLVVSAGLAAAVTVLGLPGAVAATGGAAATTPGPTASPSPTTSCSWNLTQFSASVGDGEATELFDVERAMFAASQPGAELTITVFYDPDHDGEVDVPPAGCSQGFQLEAYETEGPLWDSSGTQTWVDGQGGTVTGSTPSVTLAVTVPGCYFQTDLSSGDAEFGEEDFNDGSGRPVPDFPDVLTPGKIAGVNGGTEECTTTPPGEVAPGAPTVAEDCAAGGVLVTLPQAAGVVWTVDGDVVTAATHLVTVEEDAPYAIEVVATTPGGTTFPVGAQTEWTFEGTYDCAGTEPGVVVPGTPTSAESCSTGGVVVTLPQTPGVVWTVDGQPATGATVTVPVAAGATYAVTVVATPAAGSTFPAGTVSTWTLSGVFDCATAPGETPTPTPTSPGTGPTAPGGGSGPGVDDDTDARGVPSGTRGDRLPRTGTDALPLAGGATGLLVLGAALVIAARRREQGQHVRR